MQNHRNRSSAEPRRRETTTSASAPKTAWTKPDYTEILLCAEIGAYAFRAE